MLQRKNKVQSILKHKLTKYLAIVLVILFLIVPFIHRMGLFFSQMTLIETFISMTPKTLLKGVNILTFGVDETKSSQRSDTIIVFHLDADTQQIGVLSIPRDTRVNVPGLGMTKINHAFSHGGTKLLSSTVSEFLGIPIDHYLKVNLEGVSSLIDQVGGINIRVEKDLVYSDQAGDLHIDIKKGKQQLDGDQAIQYLRYRQDNEGDIGRIRRQQTFLKALAKKVSASGKVFELPKIIKHVNRSVETDMTKKQMVGLAVQFSEAFEHGAINKGTVPGAISLFNGVSYWKPNISALDKVVERTLFGFEQQKALAQSKIKTVDQTASEQVRRKVTLKEFNRVADNTDITQKKDLSQGLVVEVLNGMGMPGAARRIASGLKELGMKVARFGNAGSFKYQETLIVDWKGNLDHSILLAHSISIDPSRIIVYDKPNKSLDFTIVLGQDWEDINDAVNSQSEEE